MENEKKKISAVTFVLSVLTAFLLGTVLGFILAPIKKGMIIGSYNGNGEVCDDYDDLWDLQDEEDGNVGDVSKQDIDDETSSYSF